MHKLRQCEISRKYGIPLKTVWARKKPLGVQSEYGVLILSDSDLEFITRPVASYRKKSGAKKQIAKPKKEAPRKDSDSFFRISLSPQEVWALAEAVEGLGDVRLSTVTNILILERDKLLSKFLEAL